MLKLVDFALVLCGQIFSPNAENDLSKKKCDGNEIIVEQRQSRPVIPKTRSKLRMEAEKLRLAVQPTRWTESKARQRRVSTKFASL